MLLGRCNVDDSELGMWRVILLRESLNPWRFGIVRESPFLPVSNMHVILFLFNRLQGQVNPKRLSLAF